MRTWLYKRRFPGSWPGITALILAATLIAGLASAQTSASSAPLEELHDNAQIRALTPTQAARKLPVHLRGVVSVDWGWNNAFYFQDKTGGVAVIPVAGNPTVSAGQEVEILGITEPGKFAPAIDATSIRILGPGTLPQPPLMHTAQMYGGSWDSQRVAIQGIIRSVRLQRIWTDDQLSLRLDEGDGSTVDVRVIHFEHTDWSHLRGASVIIRGVAGTIFNANRQFSAVLIFAADTSDIKVLHPGPSDPFGAPLLPAESLLTFSPSQQAGNPVRVRGRVTSSNPTVGIYLQDDSGGVLVHPVEPVSVKLGEFVEAVGYPNARGYSPGINDAILRVLPGAALPAAPLEVNAAQTLVERDNFPYSPYDSRLLKVRGRLLEIVPGLAESVLVLEDGGVIFRGIVPGTTHAHALPAIGSVLDLTGVCDTVIDATGKPLYVRLRLRSGADLVVVARAPWWNASHARWVVLTLAVFLCLAAVIIFFTRRENHLRRLTLEDPLTGLYNRRGFAAFAEHQWQLALRQSREVTLFYIDLNDFKTINDSHGHGHGDKALTAVANILHETFRRTDIIGRMGGDEFAVLAVEAGHTSVAQLRNRLFEAVRQENARKVRPFEIKLSAGIIVCNQAVASEGIEQLLAKADAEMYNDKRRGKKNAADAPGYPGTVSGPDLSLVS